MNRRRLLSFLGITAPAATFVYRSGGPAVMGAHFVSVGGVLTAAQCDELRAAWTKYSHANELVNGQRFVLLDGELVSTRSAT